MHNIQTCAFAPGVIGLSGLLRSQMNISDSLAPEATRFSCQTSNMFVQLSNNVHIHMSTAKQSQNVNNKSCKSYILYNYFSLQKQPEVAKSKAQLTHHQCHGKLIHFVKFCWTWNGLMSSATTGPVCLLNLWTSASSSAMIFVGFQMYSSPRSPPHISRPDAALPCSIPYEPQTSLWNLQQRELYQPDKTLLSSSPTIRFHLTCFTFLLHCRSSDVEQTVC